MGNYRDIMGNVTFGAIKAIYARRVRIRLPFT